MDLPTHPVVGPNVAISMASPFVARSDYIDAQAGRGEDGR
jgi:hypothetical protein